jgi:hypothetical protein
MIGHESMTVKKNCNHKSRVDRGWDVGMKKKKQK